MRDPSSTTVGSVPSERALLSACIRHPSIVGDLAGTLSDVWSCRAHALVWAAIERLHVARAEVDLVSVAADMALRDELDAAGGADWLADLYDVIGTAVQWRHYLEIVRDSAAKRAAQTVIARLHDEAFRGDLTAAEYIQRAQMGILGLGRDDESSEVETKDALRDMVAHLELRAGGKFEAVPVPFADYKAIIPWYEPGDLVIVGARPGMGKSAFAMASVECACNAGYPCIVFSLEMTREQLLLRQTSGLARVQFSDLRVGRIRDDEWCRLSTATRAIAAWTMRIDDKSRRIDTVRASARRWIAAQRRLGRTKPPLIVVDYLQLVRPPNGQRYGSREQEVSFVSSELKDMAKCEGAAVLALSQVSRKCEERADKRPILSDLRESGSLEQDADAIVFLYRDEAYNEQSQDAGVAELLVRKQRSGCLGTVRVRFEGRFVRFEESRNG